jgi:hypothetical protein
MKFKNEGATTSESSSENDTSSSTAAEYSDELLLMDMDSDADQIGLFAVATLLHRDLLQELCLSILVQEKQGTTSTRKKQKQRDG